ncbi:MAG TPA: dTDP-glucose 4,6-dehydratase [Chloroflexota bacterium]|nr:dTDP-glucose 4,6-dehydratase [Chloroflexota bacterium]
MKILVTGGAGFIGCNFARLVLREHPEDEVVVLDKLTYAGRRENLRDLEGNPHFLFVQGDICDEGVVRSLVSKVDAVVNFAAETHVDRSILSATEFVRTNVQGVMVLCEAARHAGVQRFVQVSTDEVYGSVEVGSSRESDSFDPRSPYSASKAGGELLALSYFTTHGVPVLVTRGANNYGPYQHPEKQIPLFTLKAIAGESLPVYGDGLQVRDRLHVEDHCAGIDLVLREGEAGEAYNIGAGQELTNLAVTEAIINAVGASRDLITFVTDRAGHDRRYSLNCEKLRALGWQPRHSFDEGLVETVCWYRDNTWWWQSLLTGEHAAYFQANYGWRTATTGLV